MSKHAVALAAIVPASSHVVAEPGGRWVTSWYASPQPVWSGDFVLPTNIPRHIDNQTLRETVMLSAGGARLRLVFSNRYGTAPVSVGGVQLAPAGGEGRRVLFGGKPGGTIAPGAQLISDPVEMAVPPLAQLEVRTWFPGRTPVGSFHWGAQQTVQVAGGDWTGRSGFVSDRAFPGRIFLNGVLVEAPTQARTVVVLGDSIADGNGSTPDRNRRWPDMLATRLAAHGVAVANAGISGARLLRDGMGVNALARLEQDVLSQPGIAALIVLLGTNDIGWPGSPFARREPPVSLSELTRGYAQLIAAARARGVRVIGATLPPFEDALKGTPFEGHYSPVKEQLRQQFNGWIRHGAPLDAVLDADAVLRDPLRPQRLRAEYDSGDHLHPGDAGYAAMAQAVDANALLGSER